MTTTERALIKKAFIDFKLREAEEMDRIAASEKNISEETLYNLRSKVMLEVKNTKAKINKRILLIAAVIAVVFALVGCTVAIGNFVVRRVDNGRGTDFYTDGDGMKKSFEEFYIIDVPESFVYNYGYDFLQTKSYVFECGEMKIVFEQDVSANSSTKLNTEFTDYIIEKIGEYEVIYTVNNGFYTGIWLYDGYSFALTVKGGLEYDDFVSIIESIHIALPGEIEAIRAEGETESSTIPNE